MRHPTYDKPSSMFYTHHPSCTNPSLTLILWVRAPLLMLFDAPPPCAALVATIRVANPQLCSLWGGVRWMDRSTAATLHHPEPVSYRCFLPDLTGFGVVPPCRTSVSARFPSDSHLQVARVGFSAPHIPDFGSRVPVAPRLSRLVKDSGDGGECQLVSGWIMMTSSPFLIFGV